MSFEAWWENAKHDFEDARATSVYRYRLPAFMDVYGIDFDRVTDAQARGLDQRIFDNYRSADWPYQVITERAKIELMFNDPYWGRLEFKTDFSFGDFVFHVTPLAFGFHSVEFRRRRDDPYEYAHVQGLKVASLDDYLLDLD